MAKRISSDDKRNNYNIERIRTPMSRDELDKLYNEFRSEDDYVNFHVDLIEETHNKYMITIMNDTSKSPIKNSTTDTSHGYMTPEEASEFINELIDEGKTNSKPKAVMQNGYSKRSVDKYKELVEKEREEGKIVNEFTKPSFDDIMDNIYMNPYNGSTYHTSEEELPDDLREDVGVIIPGLIESRDEYFEFVKRLKDRGRNGLGRTVYDKYNDYLDAKDMIDQYKQALYDKYGGKEDFFNAKELGGMFGAYEYFPEVKPRFKKTAINIKLDRGMNVNELALVQDMGKRIREEMDEEISQYEVDYEYTMYENTPDKFRDLPEDLRLFHKTDINGINGFTHTDKFLTVKGYAAQLIGSKDPEEQLQGYLLKETIELEEMMNEPLYESDFTTIADEYELSAEGVIDQYYYDKNFKEGGQVYADAKLKPEQTKIAFSKFIENQLIATGKFNMVDPIDKTRVKELVNYAIDYSFDENFRRRENEKKEINSVGNMFQRQNKAKIKKLSKEEQMMYKAEESSIKAYVKEIAENAKQSIDNMNSNADNVNVSTVDFHDLTGYSKDDIIVDKFDLEATPASTLKYMKNNERFARKVYEISSDRKGDGMFSERTEIDDFVNEASMVTKPMLTENMIDEGLEIKRGGN